VRPHAYDCHVRFSDVDVYGHVNNVKYFEYYQEARIAFIRSLVPADDALTLLEASSTERQVVARIDVDYRRPILFRPEPYLVETRVTRVGTSSYDLACRIVDGQGDQGDQGDQGTVYSHAEVRLVMFDLITQRSRPIGDPERQRLVDLLDPEPVGGGFARLWQPAGAKGGP
jgi:acyl-CoA thioester hydrolase